ncbi:MAG: hypothetical protein K0R09_564 [Clostridiales bacterium]|jgi:hypothetical protein|nr:hypothetical protein [Clostridiales bacterium]
MKIGVIGPGDSVDKVINVINEYYPFVEPIPYRKEKVEEVMEIIDDCSYKADGLLFTGIAVLGEAEKYSKLNKPYEAIMRNDSSIMKTFWEIENDNKPIKRMSIDIVEENLVKEIANEFGIKIENIYTMPYQDGISEEEYTKRHIQLWEEGKVDIIISALGAVYNELKERKLPAYRLSMTVPLIKLSMQNLINKVRTSEIKANQIAIQILKLKNIKAQITSQYDNLIKRNSVEKELINYVREVQASFFQLGTDKYIIFGTRRTLEDELIINSFLKIVKNFDMNGITIYSGLGFGNTGWNAEYNATIALEIAEKCSNAAFYIVDENSKARGPICDTNESNYDLLVYDEKINEIAKKVGVSSTYLSKIVSIMKKTNKNTFSSDTFGHYLGVTERSGRRLLEKFICAGYAEVVTNTVDKGIGRPKKIVEMRL